MSQERWWGRLEGVKEEKKPWWKKDYAYDPEWYEKLFPLRIRSFDEELETVWGRRWGAQGELGKLRSVVVCRPSGNESSKEKKDQPDYLRLRLGVWDAAKMKEQHDDFVKILKKHVDEVVEWKISKVYTGPYHATMVLTSTRGYAVVIKGGAIIGRSAFYNPGAGKPVLYTQMLADLGVPILYTIHGNGSFTGAHEVFVDPLHMCIANMDLGSMDGITQVTPVLRRAGVEHIHVTHLSPFVGDLDEGFGMADVGLGVFHGLPKDSVDYLQNIGVSLIEAPAEEHKTEACNFVALEPGKIIMPAGNPKTSEALRKEGVDVIETNLGQFATSGIGARCLTCPLIRDDEPTLGERGQRKPFLKKASARTKKGHQ